MTAPTMRSIILAELDALEVPDCDVRRAAMALLAIVESPDRPGHMPMAHDALAALMYGIRDLYVPRAPLQVQLDAERAANQLRRLGFDVPNPQIGIDP